MKKVEVVVIVEGVTEEKFIKNLVAPALKDLHVFVKPLLMTTSSSGARGGAVNFDRLKKNAKNLLRQNPPDVVSTLIDLYGLDTSFPGFDSLKAERDLSNRLAHLESALHVAIVKCVGCSPERFIAYIQPYEFEGLLFSDTALLAEIEPDWSKSKNALAEVRKEFATPEHINNSFETSPSKRLVKLLNPNYRKTRHGPLAAEKITLEVIEHECGHFRSWMDKLRGLSPS
jgi:hypothetical protein